MIPEVFDFETDYAIFVNQIQPRADALINGIERLINQASRIQEVTDDQIRALSQAAQALEAQARTLQGDLLDTFSNIFQVSITFRTPTLEILKELRMTYNELTCMINSLTNIINLSP